MDPAVESDDKSDSEEEHQIDYQNAQRIVVNETNNTVNELKQDLKTEIVNRLSANQSNETPSNSEGSIEQNHDRGLNLPTRQPSDTNKSKPGKQKIKQTAGASNNVSVQEDDGDSDSSLEYENAPKKPTENSNDQASTENNTQSDSRNKPKKINTNFLNQLESAIIKRNIPSSNNYQPKLRPQLSSQSSIDSSQQAINQSSQSGPSPVSVPPPTVPRGKTRALDEYPWYIPDLKREQAEILLKELIDQEGAFLVRDSTKQPYSLSVVYNKNIYHLEIRMCGERQYALGKMKPNETKFNSVPELIEYHQKISIIMVNIGNVKLIVHPRVSTMKAYFGTYF